MKKILLGTAAVVILTAAGLLIWKNLNNAGCCVDEPGNPAASDYKNATYIIEGRPITLINGLSETPAAPGSASKIITRYFGNEVKHDLNNDGREDVAFLLTQETGGSGVFFYVVAALNTPTGFVGSQAILLGDRIAPQTTHMDEGKTSNGSYRQNVIVVNYAVRLPNEPFTARLSLGKSMWIKLDPDTMQFGEVAQNFEGESAKEVSETDGMIVVDFPVKDSKISSPLTITGRARGTWFFEASFPIILTDWDGKIIAQKYATAQGDWMTTDFVPFSGTLEFTKPEYGERGFLILKKDNPSGLPQYEDYREIPVLFK